MRYVPRTDLALESKEEIEKADTRLEGVIVREKYIEEKDVTITKISIINEKGMKAIGKPVGNYITVEACSLTDGNKEFEEWIAGETRRYLQELIYEKTGKNMPKILVAGLGNRDVTPDALGPLVISALKITRKISESEKEPVVSAIAPDVMAKTGMESAEIVKGIVSETKPDIVIAIDALAARRTDRLNTTIQISDAGISPGAGVFNNRMEFNEENLKVPVIGIGVPTVIEAATIAYDSLENFLTVLNENDKMRVVSDVINGFSPDEKYELIKELINPYIREMFVTPKDIDSNVKNISMVISRAINGM